MMRFEGDLKHLTKDLHANLALILSCVRFIKSYFS